MVNPVKQNKEEFKISDFKNQEEIILFVRTLMYVAFNLNKEGKYTESRAEVKKAKDLVNQVEDVEFREYMLKDIESSFNRTQKHHDDLKTYEQMMKNVEKGKDNQSAKGSIQAKANNNVVLQNPTNSIQVQNRVNSLITSGQSYLKSGKFKEAEDAFKQVIQLNPKNFEIRTELGITLLYLNKLNEAESAIKEALKINPQSARAWYNIGLVYDKKAMYKEAEDAHRKAVTIRPNYSHALYSLARACSINKKRDEAEKYYREALNFGSDLSEPVLAEAWCQLGLLVGMKMSIAESEQMFKRALVFQPNHNQALKSLEIAQNGLKTVEKSETKDIRELAQLGDWYESEKEIKKLSVILKEMVRRDSKLIVLWLKLLEMTWDYPLLGGPSEAERLFNEAITKVPANDVAKLQELQERKRNELIETKNVLEEEVDSYKEVLQRDPKNVATWLKLLDLIWNFPELGRSSEAEKVFAEAVQKVAKNDVDQLTQIQELRRNKIKTAVEEEADIYRKMLKKDPRLTKYWMRLIDITWDYPELGGYPEAERLFHEAVDKISGNDTMPLINFQAKKMHENSLKHKLNKKNYPYKFNNVKLYYIFPN